MTKHLISAYLIIVLFLFLMISCSKENSNNTSQSYRVTEIISDFSNGTYDSAHIQYEGERISSYYMYQKSATMSVQESRLDCTYPDAGSVIQSFYFKDSSGNWVLSTKSKLEQSQQGDVKMKKYYTWNDNVWYLISNYSITYAGEIPEKTENVYYDNAGDTSYQWKETFSYKNQLMQEAIISFKEDDEWVNYHKEVADFNGEQVRSITIQYYNIVTNQWEDRYLTSYQYSNNKVLKRENFVFQDETWVPSNEACEFGYDIEGNLINEHLVGFGAEVNKTYRYEKGKGNYDELFMGNDFSIQNWVEPRVTMVGRLKVDYLKGVSVGKNTK